jgi:IS30 family transposase
MNYKHLTAADRGIIEGMLKNHCTPSEIASELGVDPTTVSREINKRSTPNGYKATSAQLDYERRRKHSKQRSKLSDRARQKYICRKLQLGWSPEQISGRLRLLGEKDLYVCPETIYHWLYTDSWAYGQEQLYQYLRFGRKKRKKQNGRSKQRMKIPNRVSIHQRPAIVNQRVEYGHWETDSVIYPRKYAINSLNELSLGRVYFTKLKQKTAEATAQAQVTRLKEDKVLTITADNGTEHIQHEKVSQTLNCSFFFADAYASWQRGANENVNMLLRGYLPKRTPIDDLTQEELNDIAEELNNRPRKRHGFRTPNEMYQLLLQSKKGEQPALGSRM